MRSQIPFKCIINCISNLDSTTVVWLSFAGPAAAFQAPVASRIFVLPSLLLILQSQSSSGLQAFLIQRPSHLGSPALWDLITGSVNRVGPAAWRLFQTPVFIIPSGLERNFSSLRKPSIPCLGHSPHSSQP